jgi:hypothetical protein
VIHSKPDGTIEIVEDRGCSSKLDPRVSSTNRRDKKLDERVAELPARAGKNSGVAL